MHEAKHTFKTLWGPLAYAVEVFGGVILILKVIEPQDEKNTWFGLLLK